MGFGTYKTLTFSRSSLSEGRATINYESQGDYENSECVTPTQMTVGLIVEHLFTATSKVLCLRMIFLSAVHTAVFSHGTM